MCMLDRGLLQCMAVTLLVDKVATASTQGAHAAGPHSMYGVGTLTGRLRRVHVVTFNAA